MSAIHRIVPRVVASVALLLSVGALCGCVGEKPDVEPSASASAVPVFATDDEMMRAIDTTYAGYLAASDLITSSSSAETSGIRQWTTASYLLVEQAGLQALRERGITTVGSSMFDSLQLQQVAGPLQDGTLITVYLCSDISNVRLLDAAGQDVTPADRPNRLPLEIDFEISSQTPSKVLIDRSDVWSGDDFC